MVEEREKVVHVEGSGRGGSTAIAVIVVILLLVVLFYFFGQGLLGGDTREIKTDVDVSAPAGGSGG